MTLALVERTLGLWTCRVLHLGLALLVAVQVFLHGRRLGGSLEAAALTTVAFLALACPRLVQLRPDLPTMAATLCTSAVFLAERPPGRRRVLLTAALWLLWANWHSLFLVGPALAAAATIGAWLEDVEARRLGVERSSAAGPLAVLLGAGLLATALNPQGLRQHMTFFRFGAGSALWRITDEWSPFAPFVRPDVNGHNGVYLAGWGVMNAVLLLFPAVFLALYLRARRDAGGPRISTLAPAHFLAAAATLGAVFVSSRFLWLAVLPLLYVLRSLNAFRAWRGRAGRWVCAAAAGTLAASFAAAAGFRPITADVPPLWGGYLQQAFNERRYPVPGVRFLEDAGLEGRLFNHYTLGGFLGYRLAPALRTFVDGRTEHYTEALRRDTHAIIRGAPAEAVTLLDAYGVDVFFGFGGELTGYQTRRDTLRRLRDVPGWLLVFRTVDHSLFLRDVPRNAENLARVERYYASRGLPFSRARGFEPALIVTRHERWALAQRMLPDGYAALRLRALEGGAGGGEASRILGAYERVLDLPPGLLRRPLP